MTMTETMTATTPHDWAGDVAHAGDIEAWAAAHMADEADEADLAMMIAGTAAALRAAPGAERWWICRAPDGAATLEEAATAREAAQAYVAQGPDPERSCAWPIDVWRPWEPREEYEEVIVVQHAAEPRCDGHRDGHDWISPHELVGGIESTPGVWGRSGCSIAQTVVCACCGLGRTETSPSQGCESEHDHTAITYEEPSDQELAALADYWREQGEDGRPEGLRRGSRLDLAIDEADESEVAS